MPAPNHADSRGYRPPRAAAYIGVSRSTLYRLTRTPGFPKPIKLAENSVVFDRFDLDAWLDAKKTEQTKH